MKDLAEVAALARDIERWLDVEWELRSFEVNENIGQIRALIETARRTKGSRPSSPDIVVIPWRSARPPEGTGLGPQTD